MAVLATFGRPGAARSEHELPPLHGIGFAKGCVGQTPVGGRYTCSFLVSNTIDQGPDTLTVTSIVDRIDINGNRIFGDNGDRVSENILTTAIWAFTGGSFCNGDQTLCTLPPGSEILAAGIELYTVPDSFNPSFPDYDPNPLQDRATLTWQDTCDKPFPPEPNCPIGDQAATTGSQSIIVTTPPPADSDFDGEPDSSDNCVDVANPNQADWNDDAEGDACDEGRYVAFGDSVPYGHGLANPTTSTQSDLAANQGPAQDAYPSWLAQDLGLTFELRSTGCELSGDNLAVSGATSSRANVLGKDVDCPNKSVGPFKRSTLPHKSLDPEELQAARLTANPVDLVTIQVGADDIDFAGCIKRQIANSFDSVFSKCARRDKQGNLVLDPKVAAQLATLKTSLDSIVDQIRADTPTSTVVLIGYYQIMPESDEDIVRDGSLICFSLGTFSQRERVAAWDDAEFLKSALNQIIQQVAQMNPGVIYAEVGDVFDGREMCTSNPAVFSGPVWRAAHPTLQGQRLLAEAVLAALR